MRSLLFVGRLGDAHSQAARSRATRWIGAVTTLGLVLSMLSGLSIVPASSGMAWASSPVTDPPTRQNVGPGPTYVVSNGDDVDLTTREVWGPQGSPYVIDGRLRVLQGASLTLLPGTVVKFGDRVMPNLTYFHPAQLLVYGGQFVAAGTAADPIVFTSIRDDSVGGDTNGDGNATQPGPGLWQDIDVQLDGLLPASEQERPVNIFDHVDVRYGGSGSGVALCQSNGQLYVSEHTRTVISNSRITNGQFAGVSIAPDQDDRGLIGIYNNYIGHNQCGLNANGAYTFEAIGNEFDSNTKNFYYYNTDGAGIVFEYNYLHGSEFRIGGSTAPDRAWIDVRYNTISDAYTPFGFNQDLAQWGDNWWGAPLPAAPTGCLSEVRSYAAPVTYTVDSSSNCPNHKVVTGWLFPSVKPALSADATTLAPYAGDAQAPRFGPVNVNDGSLTYDATDLTVPDVGDGLTVTRTYRSNRSGTGDLGSGWSHDFAETATPPGESTGGSVTLPTGDTLAYGLDDGGGAVGQRGNDATLTLVSGGAQLSSPNQEVHTYNNSGQLTAISQPGIGRDIHLTYTNGQLDRITGASTRWISFPHSGSQLTGLSDSSGRTVGYSVSGGRLTAATGVDGNSTTYAYDSSGHLSGVTSPSGVATLTASYGTNGKVTWIEENGQGRATFDYHPDHTLVTRGPAGGGTSSQDTTERFDFDTAGRLTQHGVVGGSATHVIYDGNSRPIATITMPTLPGLPDMPAVTFTHYDKHGDPTLTVNTHRFGAITTFNSGHQPLITSYDQDGGSVTRAYTNGRLTALTDVLGNTTTTTYNSLGLPTAISSPDPTLPDETRTYANNGDLQTITDRDGNTTHYDYDSLGRVTDITDPRGGHTLSTYTPWSALATSTNPRGAVTSYDYDDDQRLTQLTQPHRAPTSDPRPSRTNYSYDAQGRLDRVTDALGDTITRHYDIHGRVSDVTDARNNTMHSTYTPDGLVDAFADPTGGVTRYTYDANGYATSTTDPDNRTTLTDRNSAGDMTRAETADGATTTSTYDTRGRLTRRTSPRGDYTDFVYDDANRLLRTDHHDPSPTNAQPVQTTRYTYTPTGAPQTVTDSIGRLTTYDTDANGNITKITDPLGVDHRYTYDPTGNVSDSYDADGSHTQYGYTADNQLAAVTDPNNHTTTYRRNVAGLIDQITDPANRVTTITYDPLGREHQRTYPSGRTETFDYDANGNLTDYTDRTNATTHYHYDNANRADTITDALNGHTTIGYDDAGQVTTNTDPTNRTTTYTYDPAGRPETITAPGGGTTTITITYNPDGTIHTRTDPTGVTLTNSYDRYGRLTADTTGLYGATTYAYDNADRLTSITAPYSTSQATHTYTYDDHNNMLTDTDVDNHTTTNTYSDAGDLLTTTTPSDNTTTTYTYDLAHQLTDVEDPLAHSTHYTYDPAGQRTNIHLPRGGDYTFTYAPDGWLASQTDPDHALTTYGTDGDGRLNSVDYPSGRHLAITRDSLGRPIRYDAGSDWRTLGYDAAGRLTASASATLAQTYTYTAAGYLATVTDNAGTDTFGYDDAGRLNHAALRGTPALDYTYDDAGRLATITGPTEAAATYHYRDNGGVGSGLLNTITGQITETFGHDELGRLTHHDSGLTGYTNDLTYNRDGRLATQTQSALTNSASTTTTYTYDDAGRLTDATGTNTLGRDISQHYTWDADGNRTSIATGTNAPVTTSYDPADRAISSSDGRHYTYNADGNLTTTTKDGQLTPVQTNTYDGFGLLSGTTLTTPAGALSTFHYNRDGLGRLSARTTATTSQTLGYVGLSNQLASYTDTALSQTTRLEHDPTGQLIAVNSHNTVSNDAGHVVLNHHGDVAAIATTVPSSSIYDPFGKPTTSGQGPAPVGYQADYTDPASGIVDMGARSYDPTQGTFLQPDSVTGDITSPISLNRYTYANGDPIDYFDPDGHWPDWADKAVGWAVDKAEGAYNTARDLLHRGTEAAGDAFNHVKDIVGSAGETLRHAAASAAHFVEQHKQAILTIGSIGAAGAICLGTVGAGCIAIAASGAAIGGGIGAAICDDGNRLECAGTGALIGASGALGGAGALSTTGLLRTAAADALGGLTADSTSQAIRGTFNPKELLYSAATGVVAGPLLRSAGRLLGAPRTSLSARATSNRALSPLTADAANTEEALVGAGRSVGPGAAHVSDPAFGGDLSRVIDETVAGKGDITSGYLLNSDEALQLGEQFLGPGYRELGDAGSGVFRSADDLRQFRMDPGSLMGSHAPGVPHVHLEIFNPGARFPWANNHIPFYDEVWP